MDAQMQTQFTQAVLLVVAITIGCGTAAYLFKLWEVKQSQIIQNKWILFNWIVAKAVIGTEQLWRANLIKKDARLSNAVDIVQREVNEWGLRGFDTKRITDACIAAVGDELNKERLVAEKVPMPDIPIGAG